MAYRPSWIVLSPAPVKKLDDLDYPKVRGKTYTAIVQPEPGAMSTGEHDLAKRLSKKIAKRHYVLTLAPYVFDPDHGTDSIDVYEAGKNIGRLAIDPAGRLATHFGCKVEGLTDEDRKPVSKKELTLIKPRAAKKGEIKLFGMTISALADLLDEDWYGMSLMFDEMRPNDFAPAVKALAHADADTRRVAAIALQSAEPLDGWLAKAASARDAERDKAVRKELDDLLETWEEG